VAYVGFFQRVCIVTSNAATVCSLSSNTSYLLFLASIGYLNPLPWSRDTLCRGRIYCYSRKFKGCNRISISILYNCRRIYHLGVRLISTYLPIHTCMVYFVLRYQTVTQIMPLHRVRISHVCQTYSVSGQIKGFIQNSLVSRWINHDEARLISTYICTHTHARSI
jgi:hypothetical protein